MTDVITEGAAQPFQVEPPDSTEHLGDPTPQLSVTRDTDSEVWKQAAQNEADVFIKSGYIDSADELAEEYAPYLPKTFMLGVEVDGKVAGSIRFIDYDPKSGFKTMSDIEKGRLIVDEAGQKLLAETDPAKMVEIGTIAVDKAYQASSSNNDFKLVGEFYGSIYNIGTKRDVPFVLASFDAQYFNRFVKLMGPGVKQLGPAVDYMGSPTIPALLDVNEAYASLKEFGFTDLVDQIDAVDGRIGNLDEVLAEQAA